jgi:uncharacterized protein
MENNQTSAHSEIVKRFFEAISKGDVDTLISILDRDIEWIIPGENWALAGTHHGHDGIIALLKKSSKAIEMTYPEPPEYVIQEDRVLVIGVAIGKVKASERPFKDEWVFDFKLVDGKIAYIREYMDTQALAKASEKTDA